MFPGKKDEMVLYLTVTMVALLHTTAGSRVWKSLYMDQTDDCERLIRNDDMEEGDMYEVLSDSWEGQSGDHWDQRPAECSNGFNFGDRHVSVRVESMWCNEGVHGPFVAVYDNCDGVQHNLLARLNCSNINNVLPNIRSRGSCISLYHYRGHTKEGYFFKTLIIANDEILAFPVGGIAALIMCCIITTMVVIKLICAITGYENKLPRLNLDPDEERQIIESATEAIKAAQQEDDNDNAASVENLLGDDKQYSARVITAENGHRVLRVTRSNGSGGNRPSTSGASGGGAGDEYDYFEVSVDGPVTPQLPRYPSIRRGSIWRK